MIRQFFPQGSNKQDHIFSYIVRLCIYTNLYAWGNVHWRVFLSSACLAFLFAFVRIKLVRQQDSKTVHTQCSCWPIRLSVVYFSVADTREQTILSNIKSFISDLLIVCRKEPNQSETLSERFSSLLKFINVKNNCFSGMSVIIMPQQKRPPYFTLHRCPRVSLP